MAFKPGSGKSKHTGGHTELILQHSSIPNRKTHVVIRTNICLKDLHAYQVDINVLNATREVSCSAVFY